MTPFARWSNRRKAAAAAALALLLWVPQGVSEQTQPVVTGHSTFYNGQGYDPCLASIAGIVRTQVLWFNDMVLAERYGGKGTYVYVTENASDNPTPAAGTFLYTEGVFYDFVDPNGAHWHVDEAFMHPKGKEQVDYELPSGTNDPSVGAHASVWGDKTYVWVVSLAEFPIHDQFSGSPDPSQNPNAHDIYNFLVMVDTCKFHRSAETSFNGEKRKADGSGGYDFNVTHNSSTYSGGLGAANGHPIAAANHTHEAWMASIFIGGAPTLIPAGASTDAAAFESSWAQSSSGQESAQRAPDPAKDRVGADGS